MKRRKQIELTDEGELEDLMELDEYEEFSAEDQG